MKSYVKIFFLLFACSSYEQQVPMNYKVISICINNWLGECEKTPIDSIYIADSSKIFDEFSKYINQDSLWSNNVSKEVFDSLVKVNSYSIIFKNMFSFILPSRILTNKEIRAIQVLNKPSVKLENWKKAGGVKYFSNVGFNNANTEALFYYSGYAGPLAGSGVLVYMKKEKREWKVIKTFELWVN